MIFDDAILREIGIFQYGIVEAKDIVFANEVRRLCERNLCRNYGITWACPPAVGTVEECKAKCMEYDEGLVFSGKYNLEDSFDYEGMVNGLKEFKKVCDRLYALAKEKSFDFMLFSNEGCQRCDSCTYPDNPCRYPDKLFPSVESFGIMVPLLANSAKINYINGAGTVTYFGMLLYKKEA
jgi:predicted metal-binding protein